MSEAARIVLCIGCALLLAGFGLALWFRSSGGARTGSGRWFAAVLLVIVGAAAALTPLVGMFLVSRL